MSTPSNTIIKNDIERSYNDFSFVDTFSNFVGNNDYKSGYYDFIKNKETDQAFLWTSLDAIGKKCGETLYSNVINYIDLVSNVDLCKVKSLNSMASLLGGGYSVFESVESFPLDIKNVINVLSLNKKYLFDSNVLNNNLINDLKKNVTTNISNDYSDISSNTVLSVVFDQKKFENYLSSVYTNILSSSVYETYYNDGHIPNKFIYEDLAPDLLDKKIPITLSSDIFRSYKLQYNIPLEFNEKKIVDNIDIGQDNLKNYNGYKLELLKKEIDRRKEAYDVSEPTSRYKYYKEKRVKEYFNFIENKVHSDNEQFYDNPYELNKNYLEIKGTTKKYLLRETEHGLVVDNDMIVEVAMILTRLTVYISELREKIKSQAQKNYMKGTFNLLSYVINEYLIEFSKQARLNKVPQDLSSNPDTYLSAINLVKSQLGAHRINDVNIIEYDDPTEYFNINTKTTKLAKNKNFTNPRYWEEKEPSTPASGITLNQIENYYLNVLNMKNEVGDIDEFLRTVYSIGADTGYIDSKTGKVVVQDEDDKKVKEYQETIFLNYSGANIGYDPYYNYKNVTHSSYQIHPYLYNFVEHIGYSFPVVNAFYSGSNLKIEDATVEANLSNYIGQFGQTINLWLNNSYDYSGYRTRYESSEHTGILNNNNSLINSMDYDGAFYPPAIDDFLLNYQDCVYSVLNQTTTSATTTFYEKYYANLGLTPEEYTKIAHQLSSNYSLIREKAESKQKQSDVYDIYKYSLDRFDNSYILFKKYENTTPTYKEKENTPGELWIRLRNHPIAMPALFGENPILETNDDYINGKFKNIASNKQSTTPLVDDKNHMAYFYDMDFDSSKRVIYLIDWPVNDILDHPELVGKVLDKDIQQSDIIVSVIDTKFNFITKCYDLKFLPDKNGDVDSIDNPRLVPSDILKPDNFLFKGFYKTQSSVSFVYVKNNNTKNQTSLNFSIFSYSFGNQISVYNNVMLDLIDYLKFLHIRSPEDVKISFDDDILTVACISDKTTATDLSSTNYFGGETYYPSRTKDKKDEYNSFDSMDGFISIVDTKFTGYNLTVTKYAMYNLNADPSYIPQYAGLFGKNNIYLNNFYNKTPNNNIELLGYTNNKFENYIDYTSKKYGTSDNIDAKNEDILDFSYELSSLKSNMFGRVYQDYDDIYDKTFFSYTNPLMTDKNQYYKDNIKAFQYKIDITDVLGEYQLSDMGLLLYNTDSYCKNPYFMGKIDTISGLNDKINYSDKNTVIGEVSSYTNPSIFATGTYNFYKNETSRGENNRLYNINGIGLDVDKTPSLSSLVVTLSVDNTTLPTFIQDGLLNCIVFNYSDLRMYRFYHYLDSMGVVKNGMINGIPLSSLELSNYNNLSSVPGLSGYNNLDFKYDEEQTFSINDPQWYYPGMNDNYPFRAIQLIDFLTTAKDGSLSGGSSSVLSGAFNSENLFLTQLENGNIVNEIGDMSIPIVNKNNTENCVRAYEDYIQNTTKYNTSDPRIFEYVHFCTKDYSVTSSNISVEIPNSYIEANDLSGYANNYLSSFNISQTESYFEELETDVYNYNPTNDISLSNYLNVYSNYSKIDGKIVLYFNYSNYLNSPYVKTKNGKTTLSIIPRTYLKLDQGKDGYLDIVVQFKKYNSDKNIEFYKNVILITYHIYNISDDKPKYLIYTESKVSKNNIVYNKPATKAFVKVESETKIIDVPQSSKLKFTANLKITTSRNMKDATTSILFNSNDLKFVYSKFKTEMLDDGYLKVYATNVKEKYINIPLEFETIGVVQDIYKGNDLIYNFVLDDSTVIDMSGRDSICTNKDGVIRFNY